MLTMISPPLWTRVCFPTVTLIVHGTMVLEIEELDSGTDIKMPNNQPVPSTVITLTLTAALIFR